jgi:hypothetical protein
MWPFPSAALALVWPRMATRARTGVLAAAAGWTGAVAWAPDWRGAFARALTREVEERRFFLWIPVAAMGASRSTCPPIASRSCGCQR